MFHHVKSVRGPWNEGMSSQLGEEWQYVANPLEKVRETEGLTDLEPEGTSRTLDDVAKEDRRLSERRSEEIINATEGATQWSTYSHD